MIIILLTYLAIYMVSHLVLHMWCRSYERFTCTSAIPVTKCLKYSIIPKIVQHKICSSTPLLSPPFLSIESIALLFFFISHDSCFMLCAPIYTDHTCNKIMIATAEFKLKLIHFSIYVTRAYR